jgi:hypothetical protein
VSLQQHKRYALVASAVKREYDGAASLSMSFDAGCGKCSTSAAARREFHGTLTGLEYSQHSAQRSYILANVCVGVLRQKHAMKFRDSTVALKCNTCVREYAQLHDRRSTVQQ